MIYVVSFFLFAFLTLSFLKEFPKCSHFLNRAPILMSFIPTWSFFAPTPGMHDYYLLCREIDKQEQVGEWQEVFPVKEKRSPFAVIWNPEKKRLKSLIDLVQQLMQFSAASNDELQICTSIPYLHILNYISKCRHEPCAKKVQFMILSSSRLSDYKVEFVSNVHQIEV